MKLLNLLNGIIILKSNIMTTEEIEKEAGRYSGEELASGYPYVHPAHQQSIEIRHEAFKAGADFVNKHWQEKTRWIPIEERFPNPLPFEDVGEIANGDLLLVKHIGYGSIEFGVLREVNNVKYWELPDCGNFEINEISHWKEIE